MLSYIQVWSHSRYVTITTFNKQLEDVELSYLKNSASMQTDNGRQNEISKTLQDLDYIKEPTKYSTYKPDKNLVLSEPDQGLI